MGRGAMMMLVVAILAMDLITERSEATTHIVGDGMGWTVPQSNSSYTTWAASRTFAVGDILVFNFATGFHDVATVTKANHDACNTTNPISLITIGPTNITLTSGSHYYICTFGAHCSSGQKLAISVSTGSASPSPSPSPSTPTPSSPSPAPSTATAPSPGTSAPAPATATPPSPKTPSPSPSSSTSPSPSSPSSPPSPAGTPPSATPPAPAAETPGSTTSPPPPPPPPSPSFAPSVATASGVTFLAIALALVY